MRNLFQFPRWNRATKANVHANETTGGRIPFSPATTRVHISFSLSHTFARPFPASLVPKNGHRVHSSVTENGVCVFSQVLISDAATADEYEEIQLDPGNAILPDTAVDRSGDFLYVLTTTKVSISIKRTHPETRHPCRANPPSRRRNSGQGRTV